MGELEQMPILGDEAAAVARRQIRPGHSLPKYYYESGERYARDLEILKEKAWLLAGHASQIPAAGDYFIFHAGNESIVIVRSRTGDVNAFYNVCRHRGSRVCLEQQGHLPRFVCPYHAWTYDLDGRLIGAADMPAGFERAQHGLKPCHVGVFDGVIFVNLATGEAPDFEAFSGRARPFLAPYRLEKTKVAARENISCPANWKVLAENFTECYHCANAHRSLSRTHRLTTMLRSENGGMDRGGEVPWIDRMKSAGLFAEPLYDDASRFDFQSGIRMELGGETKSGAIDGGIVAPRLGDLPDWTGSWAGVFFNPIAQISCYDDHALLFSFVPRGPVATDCHVTWLVHEDAVEGRDYEVDRVRALWQVTMAEDRTICADNQRGISSAAYEPGPYSLTEFRVLDTIDWYIRHFVDVAARPAR